MKNKKTFTIKLNTEFEIDLAQWDYEGWETEQKIRKELIQHYFDEIGFEEIEFKAKQPISLFEVVADNVQKRNEHFLKTENKR